MRGAFILGLIAVVTFLFLSQEDNIEEEPGLSESAIVEFVEEERPQRHTSGQTPPIANDPALELRDLGTTKNATLSLHPFLVSGKVVNDDGRPVAGAIVICQEQRRRRHSVAPSYTATTDEQGRYVAYGDFDNRVIKVSVFLEGFIAESRIVEKGSRNIDFQLGALGRLRAKIAFPTDGKPPGLFVKLTGEDTRHEELQRLDFDSVVELEAPSGRYTLAILQDRVSTSPLLERRGLQLLSGLLLDLGELAIDSSVRRIEVAVDLSEFGEEPSLLGEMLILKPESDDVLDRLRVHLYGEPIAIMVRSLPVDLKLVVYGCRVDRMTVSNKKVELKLRRGLAIVPVVRGLKGLDRKLRVNVEIRDVGKRERVLAMTDWYDLTGVVPTMYLAQGGRYQLEVSIGVGDDGGLFLGDRVALKSPTRVLISNSDQDLVIDVDPESARAVLQRLRTRSNYK